VALTTINHPLRGRDNIDGYSMLHGPFNWNVLPKYNCVSIKLIIKIKDIKLTHANHVYPLARGIRREN